MTGASKNLNLYYTAILRYLCEIRDNLGPLLVYVDMSRALNNNAESWTVHNPVPVREFRRLYESVGVA
jgi:hypothetical protein